MDGNYSVNSSIEKKEASRGIRFLLFEIIVILLLAGFILGVLQYLNILDFNSFLPKPVKNITSQILTTQPSINIESRIPGYTATIVDKKGLINLLNSWKTFDKAYNFGEAGSTSGNPLKKINIYLTDKFDSGKFPWTLYKDKDGKEYLSSNITLAQDSLNLYVFVGKDILESQPKKVYLLTQTVIVSTLYKITHIPTPNTDVAKREEIIANLIKDLTKNKQVYFDVKKQ